jgi:four helix bundle protein
LHAFEVTRIAESEFWVSGIPEFAAFFRGPDPAADRVMPVRSFHDLQVWQFSMQLATDIYGLVKQLPDDERYGLSLQLRRAMVSIPSNIAEGAGYGWSSRRNIHHVRIALGSDLELQTQLMLIERLRLASPEQVQPILDRAGELGRMLNGLIKSLERHQGAQNRTSNL